MLHQHTLSVLLCLCVGTYALTVRQLTPNVPLSDTLSPKPAGGVWSLNYYKIWIPENTSVVTVGYNVRSDVCGGLANVYQRIIAAPCSQAIQDATCYQDGAVGITATDIGVWKSWVWSAVRRDSHLGWQVNTFWYIGVGRWSIYYNEDACPFSLNVTLEACPNGQVATIYGDNLCLDVLEQVSDTPVTVNTTGNAWMVKRSIPAHTGTISITVDSIATNLYVFARAGAPADSGDFDCYTTTATTISNNLKRYTTTCYVPRQQVDMYVALYWLTGGFPEASVSIELTTCPATQGGPDCLFPLSDVRDVMSAPEVIDMKASVSAVEGGDYRYYYYDVPAETSTVSSVTFTVQPITAGSTGYMHWRRNAFPAWGVSNNDGALYYKSLSTTTPTSLTVYQEDLYPGGRYYFAVECFYGNFTTSVSFTEQQAPATTTTGFADNTNTNPDQQTSGATSSLTVAQTTVTLVTVLATAAVMTKLFS